MNMLRWFYAACFAMAVLVYAFTDNWLIDLVHIANLKTEKWWVNWIGALSGWAAFVGALIALPHLASQAREAQKQTAFVLGDSNPEFIVTRDRQKRRMIMTVRNWNRRLIMVDKLTVKNNVDITVYDVSDYDDPSVPTWQMQRQFGETGAFRVFGWVDRTQPPPARRLKILLARNGEYSDDLAVLASGLSLKVSYRIVGQQHERGAADITTLEIADE
ncbi:hypothetical protein [Phyllobacterium sp. K27]